MLRDPLIHFLAAGVVLFVVFAWRGTEPPPEQILISGGRVEEIARSASLLSGRAPDRAELQTLIDPVVREEVYYREALALGLDKDDDEVRRRLVEKMRYLTENLADPEPPSDAELEAFYAAAPERFQIPETATFDQVFFSPGQRGESLEADAASALVALEGGADAASIGDRTPLEARLAAAPRERVEVLFGTELTDAVFGGEMNRWLGPYRSDFGLHLIRTVERTQARIPAFEEIEPDVRNVYGENRRREANEAAYQEIRSRYDVVVEWPEDDVDRDAR